MTPSRGPKRRWTKAEEERALDLIRDHTIAEVAEALQRSPEAVRLKLRARGVRDKRRWTKAEEQRVIELWRVNTIEQVAKELKRTPLAVQLKLNRLGVTYKRGWTKKWGPGGGNAA